MGIEAAPTMIKPNIDEIRMLTGKKCDNCLLYTSTVTKNVYKREKRIYMKKKLGMLLAVLLTFCMTVGVFADAGKTQQDVYKRQGRANRHSYPEA